MNQQHSVTIQLKSSKLSSWPKNSLPEVHTKNEENPSPQPARRRSREVLSKPRFLHFLPSNLLISKLKLNAPSNYLFPFNHQMPMQTSASSVQTSYFFALLKFYNLRYLEKLFKLRNQLPFFKRQIFLQVFRHTSEFKLQHVQISESAREKFQDLLERK